MSKTITVPLSTMTQLAHMTTKPLQFGDDMTIKPLDDGFIIIDTYGGYETTVKQFEGAYRVSNNDSAGAYDWSSEGFIQVYQEEGDDFYNFIFTL